MATITFDTHKFIKTLEASGMPTIQAEAMVTAQQESLQAAFDYRDLATKGDIAGVRSDLKDLATKDALRKVEIELAVVKWMLGTLIGGMVALLFKAFFA